MTFIWAVDSPERLSKKAMKVLQDQNSIRLISTISLPEIAIKQTCKLFDLPDYHSDLFDRQIISQSLVEEIPVITVDEKFKSYMGLKVIW